MIRNSMCKCERNVRGTGANILTISNHEKKVSTCARRLQICCFSLGFIAFNPIFFPPHSHWDTLRELLPGKHVLYQLPPMLAGWDCSKQAETQESTVTVYIHSVIICLFFLEPVKNPLQKQKGYQFLNLPFFSCQLFYGIFKIISR